MDTLDEPTVRLLGHVLVAIVQLATHLLARRAGGGPGAS